MTGLGWAFGRDDVELLGITADEQTADRNNGIPMYWQYGWSKYYDSTQGPDYNELPSIEDWDRYIAFISRKQFFMKCGGLNTKYRMVENGETKHDGQNLFTYNGFADGSCHARLNDDGTVDFVMTARTGSSANSNDQYKETDVVVMDSTTDRVVADMPKGENGGRCFGAQFFMTPKQGICGKLNQADNILATTNTNSREEVDYISIDNAIARAFYDQTGHRMNGTISDTDAAYYFAGQAPYQTLCPVSMRWNEWAYRSDYKDKNTGSYGIISTMKIPVHPWKNTGKSAPKFPYNNSLFKFDYSSQNNSDHTAYTLLDPKELATSTDKFGGTDSETDCFLDVDDHSIPVIFKNKRTYSAITGKWTWSQSKIGWKLPYDATFRFQYQNFYNVRKFTKFGKVSIDGFGKPEICDEYLLKIGLKCSTDNVVTKSNTILGTGNNFGATANSKSDSSITYKLCSKTPNKNKDDISWFRSQTDDEKQYWPVHTEGESLWLIKKVDGDGNKVEWDGNIEDVDFDSTIFPSNPTPTIFDFKTYPAKYVSGGLTEESSKSEHVVSNQDRLIVKVACYVRNSRLLNPVRNTKESYGGNTYIRGGAIIRCGSVKEKYEDTASKTYYYLYQNPVNKNGDENSIYKKSWNYVEYFVTNHQQGGMTYKDETGTYTGGWYTRESSYESAIPLIDFYDIDFESAEFFGDSAEWSDQQQDGFGRFKYLITSKFKTTKDSDDDGSYKPTIMSEPGGFLYGIKDGDMVEEQATFENGVVKLLPQYHDMLYLAITDDPVALDQDADPKACHPTEHADDVQIIPIARNGLQQIDRLTVRRGKCFNFFYTGNCHMDFQFQTFIDPFQNNASTDAET